MRLARIVATSAAVAATRSRKQKTTELGALLRDCAPDEIPTVVAWLTGVTRQGRIGVGWRSLMALDAAPAGEPTLTVTGVDDLLTRLAAATGPGSVAERKQLLLELFGGADESEQHFLRRLLTGELRQGALAGVMADAIADAAGQPIDLVRRAHMLTGSLPQTAALAVFGGAEALGAVGLEVGRAVAPMLATPADSLADAVTSLGPELVIDYKLDGARIQVHRRHDDVAVYTRSLRDITAAVPDVVAVVRELDCETVILDGETLTLDADGRPRPFQDTMSRFGSAAEHGDDPAGLLRPFFFDCLHLDGVDLIDRPLAERLAALDTVAAALRIPSVRSPDVDAAQRFFDDALAAGHEGVMAKSLDGVYAAGRRGKAWQKIKPTHTVDLVVLGAEWGSGRRTGLLSNLHLGARDPDGGSPIMVGKTFKGLTDALLAWQTDEFPKHSSGRDGHTVYLRPEIVVEIELDGVQRSSRYPGGVALRFARVVRYRPDKTAAEADTIDAIRAMLP
ncbi:ATP-dependent DNA ligase [Gordonia rhizosphera]|uniref:DNA ligase n=1 Tax=Gordonia rhizosphera NBRC 16068 TaxID=1108045 RepID=K6VCC6_9ACTN|nr:ATP-dependent DNA ligase [Gordonia rhizosphera]GAB93843.1 ATP-dependent DNA ligase LigB [Gordonia rhizosphera NBRC 16068]